MAVKCAIYCRISTDEDLQKWSLEGQKRELTELAVRKEWIVTRIYRDTVSGSKSSRPGLDRLRDDMSQGKFSVILIVDQDRLSRLEPIDWELLKQEIREAGVRLVTPVQEVNFADEDSELVSDVFNLFARHQRRKIKKAMRRGRMEAVSNGKWLGKAPYGRKTNPATGKLDLDSNTAFTVQKIFEMYAAGLGASVIGRELKGLPTPGGSSVWDQTTVIRILTNRVHRGDIERFENGKEIVVLNAFEPTVPPELYDQCQQILRRRSEEYRWYRLEQVTNLCAGILYCAECGKLLNVVSIHSKYKDKRYSYYYYRHRPRERGKSLMPECKCSFRVDQVDAQVMESVKLIGSTPQAAGRLIKPTNTCRDRKNLQARLDDLKRVEKRLTNKRKKLLQFYLEDDWEKSYLDEQKEILAVQLRNNEREQAQIKEKLKHLTPDQLDMDMIVEYFAALVHIDIEMNRKQQRELVQLLFSRIVINQVGDLSVTVRFSWENKLSASGMPKDIFFYSPCGRQGI